MNSSVVDDERGDRNGRFDDQIGGDRVSAAARFVDLPKVADPRCAILHSRPAPVQLHCRVMTATITPDLKRWILQSEADLLAHAQLRLRVQEADEILAAARQNQQVLRARATRASSKTRRLAPTSTVQES